MAKLLSTFATTFFLLVAFTSHCYAVTCVTLTGASKPPTVVAKRTFDNSATLGNSPNTLERVYVNGRSIDEPLLAAIDGDSDGFLNSSKNTTNGVNLVDAEYYYLSNRLGSISAILDADNQDRILEYYRYEVFGSATVLPIVDNNTDGLEDTPLNLNDNNASGPALVSSFGNTYLFTARRFDDITGLYYYRNRYYDPRSGRFFTKDPIRATRYNLYNYVNHRTTRFTDPSGKVAEEPERHAASKAGAEARVTRYCARGKLSECGQIWNKCACKAAKNISLLVHRSDFSLAWAMDDEVDINATNAQGNNLRDWLLCIGACIMEKYDDYASGSPSTKAWKRAQLYCDPDNCHDTRTIVRAKRRSFIIYTKWVTTCRTWNYSCCESMVEAEQKGITDCETKCGKYLTSKWGKIPPSVFNAVGDMPGDGIDMASESKRIKFGKNYCCTGKFNGKYRLIVMKEK